MDRKRYRGGQFFSEVACRFMDAWGRSNGYKFEHAMNGKELQVAAYWVDGYDSEKNVIFEYDEPHHYNKKGFGNLRKKDILRMERIQSETKCIFIRYNERLDTITYYVKI